ncbi:MAG: exodeoxyribonuclease VII small subunit [Anaerolineales bacterium]|nr:exodeoxyribonuclease VII small subunit [Anaerolineales bacterium]
MSKTRRPEELNYEQAFKELETAVQRLEAGELPLEEAMTLFERGQALAGRCGELLDQAELKLRQLVPDEGGGYAEADLTLEEEGE